MPQSGRRQSRKLWWIPIRDTSGRWTRRERRARTTGRCRRVTPSRARLYAGCPSPTGGCSVSRRPRNSASPLRCGSCRCRPGGSRRVDGDRSRGSSSAARTHGSRGPSKRLDAGWDARATCLIRALVAELLLDAHDGADDADDRRQKDRGRRVPRARVACARGSRAGRRDDRRVRADGQLDGAARVSVPLQDRAPAFETGSDLRHRYGVYGIRVLSDAPLDLPEYADDDLGYVECVTARPASFADALNGATFRSRPDSWYRYAFLQDGSTYVRWDNVGEFLVSADGRRILPARRQGFLRVVSGRTCSGRRCHSRWSNKHSSRCTRRRWSWTSRRSHFWGATRSASRVSPRRSWRPATGC